MDVIEAAATKWNFNVYYPGAGVGGHCLPVDPYYLVKKAEELGYHSKVITAGRAVNDYMPLHVFELLVDALNECERAVKGSKVVVLGFSYKENVGEILHHLRRRGVKYCKDLCLKTAIIPSIRPEFIKIKPVI
jgi:UDP-N-acetyl-D-mannosaminuronate dehydrogenase